MQSGKGLVDQWVAQYEPEKGQENDQLTGWVGRGDIKRQVSLTFDSKAAAVAWVRTQPMAWHVDQPSRPRLRPKAYGANFASRRPEPWTH